MDTKAGISFSKNIIYQEKEIAIKEIYEDKSIIYKGIKRGIDIIASLSGLFILSPVFLLTAVFIMIEDGGPVFFTQPRAGKEMKPFKMYKFRSMFKDADKMMKELMEQNEQTGHAFKIKNDPRITRIGKFIRKYSIDELPQLINILRGDMSLVGPRPILTFQMEECNEYARQRLTVRPGLTCYWQIGGRADIEWDEWVELDLKYIRDMSLINDAKIILKTIPVVLSGDGAY